MTTGEIYLIDGKVVALSNFLIQLFDAAKSGY